MDPSIKIRRATLEDPDLMLWVDANGEGYTKENEPPAAQEQAQLRSKFKTFVTFPAESSLDRCIQALCKC